jgi:hypothetical protein
VRRDSDRLAHGERYRGHDHAHDGAPFFRPYFSFPSLFTHIEPQFSGTLNLIVTTWEIKNWGLRTAIINQTFWPALRNLTQIYASASRPSTISSHSK